MSWGASDERESRRHRAVERAAERSYRDWRECGVETPYCSECGSEDFEEFDDAFKSTGCGQTSPKED